MDHVPPSVAGSLSPNNSDSLGIVWQLDESDVYKRPSGVKRGSYVSSACIGCQKRKVKCSGDQPCNVCRINDLECVYSSNRPKKRAALKTQSTGEKSSKSPANSAVPKSMKWKYDIVTRISKIEQCLERSQGYQSSRAKTNPCMSRQPSLFPDDQDLCSDLDDNSFQGGTSYTKSIAVLQNNAGCHSSQDNGAVLAGEKQSTRCSLMHCSDFPECCKGDLLLLDHKKNPQFDLVESFRSCFTTFFDFPHPHHPCLNESSFLSQFERILKGDLANLDRMDLFQFIALINLTVAVTKVLEGYCSDSKIMPGWHEVSRAEHLLSHASWLGKGNLLTIQCLILKASYLLYVEKCNASYDSMGNAVRLCYQIGLHNESSWKSSEFDVIMRQRVFWSLFCLDRNISLVCGAPYLIRESDFRVNLPKRIDDRMLFPDKPIPEENEIMSAVTYQHIITQLGKLSSEVWDAMFGMSAQRPVSQELIAIMDTRIKLLISEIPSQLQWMPENLQATTNSSLLPRYIIRQSLVFFLRANYLRLLLRQDEMVNLRHHRRTAEACVTIAESSVDAVYTYHMSHWKQPTDRYGSVFYMTFAIIPLISVIIKDNQNDAIRLAAVESLRKALFILQDISPGFAFARHTLERFRPTIQVVNRVIMVKWPSVNKVTADMSPSTDDLDNLPGTNVFSGLDSMDDNLGMYEMSDLFHGSVDGVTNAYHFEWNWNNPVEPFWFENDRDLL